MRKRIPQAVIGAAGLIIGLAACGDGGSSAAQPTAAPSAPTSTAPAAAPTSGTSPGWMGPDIQADLDSISRRLVKIHTDAGQLVHDANAQNTSAVLNDGLAVAGDGTNLSADAEVASADATTDGGVPDDFQTAMTDFEDAGAAIEDIEVPAETGDYATVNTDISKFNSTANQGQAALTDALSS